ncbi:hypothetical protein FKM82_025381 [Ascaphus truei]
MPILGPFAENWENVEKFQARADDLLIITYPKSGELYQGCANFFFCAPCLLSPTYCPPPPPEIVCRGVM